MKAFALAAALATLVATQAHADCTIAHADIPLNVRGLRATVDAKVSGEPVKLILDTGAFYSQLSPNVVTKLGLKPVTMHDTGSNIRDKAVVGTTGIGGKLIETALVNAPTFEFGGAEFPNVQFLSIPGFNDTDGLLGQNVMHAADSEFDFKNKVFKLVKPTGCEKQPLAYWVAPGASFSVAPLLKDDDNHHITSIVEVNGKKLRATFDTGAGTSYLTIRGAAKAGVKTTDPGVKAWGETHGVDQTAVKTWVAPFASIKIGDEEIKNVNLAVGTLKSDDYDILIGADFFMSHHVYVANSQGKIYFSYNGGPVFAAAAMQQAAASTAAKN